MRAIEVVICLFSALSGFLFGYDLCVIVVAIEEIVADLYLNTSEKETVVSLVMIGAAIGSVIAGEACDRIGRRASILATSVLFLAGGFIMALAQSLLMLLCGRLIVGLAVGASGPCVSIYLSEIAEPKFRGVLVTVNELLLCVGCFVSVAVSSVFIPLEHGWRYMLGITAVPALIQLLGMPCLPKSPVYRRNADRLSEDLSKQQPIDASGNSFSVLWNSIRKCRSYRKRFLISLGIASGQAFTASNAVLYFSRSILDGAGVSDPLTAELGIAAAKLIGVSIALLISDRVGRRTLLLWGSVVMCLCHVSLAVLFLGSLDTQQTQTPFVIVLHLFIFAWNISWAPMMWLVCSEILPDKLRSAGMGLSLAVYWLCSFVVNQSILSLFESIGKTGSFVLYAGTTFCALVFVHLYVPETKGRSLDEISLLFQTDESECPECHG